MSYDVMAPCSVLWTILGTWFWRTPSPPPTPFEGRRDLSNTLPPNWVEPSYPAACLRHEVTRFDLPTRPRLFLSFGFSFAVLGTPETLTMFIEL